MLASQRPPARPGLGQSRQRDSGLPAGLILVYRSTRYPRCVTPCPTMTRPFETAHPATQFSSWRSSPSRSVGYDVPLLLVTCSTALQQNCSKTGTVANAEVVRTSGKLRNQPLPQRLVRNVAPAMRRASARPRATDASLLSSKANWRRCMGVEPTLDQDFNPGRATRLKTAHDLLLNAPASSRRPSAVWLADHVPPAACRLAR